MTTPLFLLRCVQLGISIRDLDLLTIGMVNDMYVESGNDQDADKKYSVIATQADFDRFQNGGFYSLIHTFWMTDRYGADIITLEIMSMYQIVKERIEGGANEKAVLRLFINCPFVCINFDFFWLNKARQLYLDF